MTYYQRLLQASAVTVLLTALVSSAQQEKQGKASQHDAHSTASTYAKASNQAQQEDGDKVFQQHCSRCHTAPDGFSPRISGTVAMHMRVRASLSEREMQALLRFLNP